jgi:hypothetical protein
MAVTAPHKSKRGVGPLVNDTLRAPMHQTALDHEIGEPGRALPAHRPEATEAPNRMALRLGRGRRPRLDVSCQIVSRWQAEGTTCVA